MTILNDGLGGSDAVDGTALPAANWNDTMDVLRIFSTALVDSATHTNGTNAYVTASTFTLTNLDNNMLLGFRLQAQTKTTSGGEARLRIRIVGSNTGDYRITSGNAMDNSGSTIIMLGPYTSTVDGSTDYLHANINTAYSNIVAQGLIGLKVQDASLIIATQIKDDGSHTNSTKNTNLFIFGVGRSEEI